MNNENTMKLFHTSSKIIESPDVDYGRRNADFGGGFYLSDSIDFAKKWANEGNSCVNFYTFDLTGLNVKRFEHSEEWFKYISKNRAGYSDELKDADVIIGPIANDTLYDTYGIITSGLISITDALKLLGVGNSYYQINIKSKKAVSQLKWENAQFLTADEIARSKEYLKAEEKEFQKAFSQALTELDDYERINKMLS